MYIFVPAILRYENSAKVFLSKFFFNVFFAPKLILSEKKCGSTTLDLAHTDIKNDL